MKFFRLRNKLFLFVLLAIVAGWGVNHYYPTAFTASSYFATSSAPAPLVEPTVEIEGVVVPVDLATSTAAIEQGLSGRESLDPKRGMLFIFERSARYQFWMPDMHFPID